MPQITLSLSNVLASLYRGEYGSPLTSIALLDSLFVLSIEVFKRLEPRQGFLLRLSVMRVHTCLPTPALEYIRNAVGTSHRHVDMRVLAVRLRAV